MTKLRLGDMTDRDVFWHNFRTARRNLAGQSREEVHRNCALIRLGPFGAAMVHLIEAAQARPC